MIRITAKAMLSPSYHPCLIPYHEGKKKGQVNKHVLKEIKKLCHIKKIKCIAQYIEINKDICLIFLIREN